MNNENQLFKTRDILIASVLTAFGQQLVDVNKDNPRSAVFCFHRSADIDQLINAYWSRELKVAPQLIFSALKELKQRLYSEF